MNLKWIYFLFALCLIFVACNTTSSDSGSEKTTAYTGKITSSNQDPIEVVDTSYSIVDTCLPNISPDGVHNFNDTGILATELFKDTASVDSFYRSSIPLNCQNRNTPQETVYVQGIYERIDSCKTSGNVYSCSVKQSVNPISQVSKTSYDKKDTGLIVFNNATDTVFAHLPAFADTILTITEPFTFFPIASLPRETVRSIYPDVKIVFAIFPKTLTSKSSVIVSCQSTADTTQWVLDSAFSVVSDTGFVRLYPFSNGCQLGGGYRVTVTNP